MRIIVHNCRTQHSTEQFWLFSLLTSRQPSQLSCCLLEGRGRSSVFLFVILTRIFVSSWLTRWLLCVAPGRWAVTTAPTREQTARTLLARACDIDDWHWWSANIVGRHYWRPTMLALESRNQADIVGPQCREGFILLCHSIRTTTARWSCKCNCANNIYRFYRARSSIVPYNEKFETATR